MRFFRSFMNIGNGNSNNRLRDRLLISEFDQAWHHYRHLENQRNILIGIVLSIMMVILPLSLKYIYNDYSFIIEILDYEGYYNGKETLGLYVKSIIPISVMIVFNFIIFTITCLIVKLVKATAFYDSIMNKIREEIGGEEWVEDYYIQNCLKKDPIFKKTRFESKYLIEKIFITFSIILHIISFLYMIFILFKFNDQILVNSIIFAIELTFLGISIRSYFNIMQTINYQNITAE